MVNGSDKGTVDEKISSSLSYVGFNIDKEPFNDVKVRQAISMLINQEDILRRNLRRIWGCSYWTISYLVYLVMTTHEAAFL